MSRACSARMAAHERIHAPQCLTRVRRAQDQGVYRLLRGYGQETGCWFLRGMPRSFSRFAWDAKARYNDREGGQMLTEAARRRDEMMADPGLGSSHEEVWKRISDLRNG